MSQKYSNNAISTLAAPLLSGDTAMFVSPSHGSRWPTIVAPDVCETTLEDAVGNIENIQITAHTAGSDTFTIARAQQGTAARAWSIGDLVEMRVTAKELTAFESDIDGLQATRALKAGETYTGTHDFTAGVVTVPAATAPATPVTKAEFDLVTSALNASSKWINGATYVEGALVWSPTTFQNYRKITASSVTVIDPASDSVNWVAVGPPQQFDALSYLQDPSAFGGF
jgi:hypothetical protein